MPGYLDSSTYGIVGDGIVNDYTALQLFLSDLGNSGGLGVLAPGKYLSGGPLSIGLSPGVRSAKLIAYGATIRTDPTQYLPGLVVQNATPVTRIDETRKLIIEGLHVDQYENPMATYAIFINGSVHVVLRDVMVSAGSDNPAKANYANYKAICLNQAAPSSGDYGCFWTRLENITIKGGHQPMPMGIVSVGQNNALSISRCDLANITSGILLQADADGDIANSVRIIDNDFEGVTKCISFYGGVSNYTTLAGLIAVHNRVESCGTFFNYILNKNPIAGTTPVVSRNIYFSTPTQIYNPSSLTVVT